MMLFLSGLFRYANYNEKQKLPGGYFEMSLKNWTPKIAALAVIGLAITLLFIMGFTALWRHDVRPAALYLVIGAGLSVVFFRKRRIAFAIVVLSFLLVNVGLTALFHPTVPGLIITFASAACMYWLVFWSSKKYPNLARKDWKTLFDHDPES